MVKIVAALISDIGPHGASWGLRERPRRGDLVCRCALVWALSEAAGKPSGPTGVLWSSHADTSFNWLLRRVQDHALFRLAPTGLFPKPLLGAGLHGADGAHRRDGRRHAYARGGHARRLAAEVEDNLLLGDRREAGGIEPQGACLLPGR